MCNFITQLISCRYQSSLGNNKRVELFDMGAGSSEPTAEDNIQMASGEISHWDLSSCD
jgi:hypothetical protein